MKMLALSAAGLAFCLTSSGVARAADAEAGKKAFNKCVACHAAEPGKNKVGPSLWDVYGRKAGTGQGFMYSAAMKDSGIVWDQANLSKYLEKPSDVIKGNKMAFAGIKDPTERENVIAYLQTLK
jgi:cytochrome c